MRVVNWDEELGVLVDEQGIMLPKSSVEDIIDKAIQHLEHSDLELKALGRMTVERHGHSTALQFNWEYFE